jgi:hypothetical protein
MSYYDNCFDHITDPVQRNSVRQQWLQMIDGGLSVADVRILLDKYPDFRLAKSFLLLCLSLKMYLIRMFRLFVTLYAKSTYKMPR